MIGRMMVAHKEDREGIEYLVIFSSLAVCLAVDIFKSLFDSVFRILACEASIDEVV